MIKKPYNPDVDMPLSGWDLKNVEYYLSIGAELIIDDSAEIWTSDGAEYVGKIATS